MNTRKIAEEYRLTHWAEIMNNRIASGLSIKDFCKSAGFHENVYYYWQRKLREAACQDFLTARDDIATKAVIPSGWAMCEPDRSETSESTVTIGIGRCHVTVGADASSELLKKVCHVLISLC